MVAKPWENRLMERVITDDRNSDTTPLIKDCNNRANVSRLSEQSVVKVRKNNMTKRVSAKPPHSSSSPSYYDETSPSSSIFTTTTPVSGNTASDRTDESNSSRPNYMNLTEATKAKQRRNSAQRQSMDEFQFLKKSMAFTNADSKSSAGSDSSVALVSRPLCLPTRMDKFTYF